MNYQERKSRSVEVISRASIGSTITWDFNVLETILEQETGKTIESEFKQKIASPLNMNDFNNLDAYTLIQKSKSLLVDK